MYIYIYIYVSIYIHTYKYTYVSRHTHKYTYAPQLYSGKQRPKLSGKSWSCHLIGLPQISTPLLGQVMAWDIRMYREFNV